MIKIIIQILKFFKLYKNKNKNKKKIKVYLYIS